MPEIVGDMFTCPTFFRVENGKIRLLDEAELRRDIMVGSCEKSILDEFKVARGFKGFKGQPEEGLMVVWESMSNFLNLFERFFLDRSMITRMRKHDWKFESMVQPNSYIKTRVGNIDLSSLIHNTFVYCESTDSFIGIEKNRFKRFYMKELNTLHKRENIFIKDAYILGADKDICFCLVVVSYYNMVEGETLISPYTNYGSYIVRYAREVLENKNK